MRRRGIVTAIVLCGTLLLAASAPAHFRLDDAGGLWREIPWPFPMDEWGEGRAFRCEGGGCGRSLQLYLRTKIGFCVCGVGVADDADLDRLSDFDFMGKDSGKDLSKDLGKASPRQRGDGHEAAAAAFKGRARVYDLDPAQPSRAALAVALNSNCDAVVATALVDGGAADRAEVETLRFLAGPVAQPWLRHKLGL